jgi:hypothetical protein
MRSNAMLAEMELIKLVFIGFEVPDRLLQG